MDKNSGLVPKGTDWCPEYNWYRYCCRWDDNTHICYNTSYKWDYVYEYAYDHTNDHVAVFCILFQTGQDRTRQEKRKKKKETCFDFLRDDPRMPLQPVQKYWVLLYSYMSSSSSNDQAIRRRVLNTAVVQQQQQHEYHVSKGVH